MAAGASNMTNGEVELHLREKYNQMHGAGFFNDAVKDLYMYVWFFGSPSAVWIDWLSKHGGDAYWAQNEPRQNVPFTP